MNPAIKTVYTPPRPNLGPDPLVESPPWPGIALALTLAFAAALAWRFRRRRRKPESPKPILALIPEFETPRQQMIAWSHLIRETLAHRFGAAWLAKTTEEIASDSTLSDAIGLEPAARLLHFLAAADRAKFADTPDVSFHPLAEPELRELTDLIARAKPEAPAQGRHSSAVSSARPKP